MAPTAVLIPTLHLMIFMLGAVVGSFLNVVIYRVPRNLSVNEPRRSFCPNCKNGIPWYRNIPLFSWLMLRGKCADCGVSISARYVWVELLVEMTVRLAHKNCSHCGRAQCKQHSEQPMAVGKRPRSVCLGTQPDLP